MSLWQFMAAVEGYRKANNPDAAKELTSEEEDMLWNVINDNYQQGAPYGSRS